MKVLQLSSLLLFLALARANPIMGPPMNPPPPPKIDGLYGDSSVQNPDCSQLKRISTGDTKADWIVVALCAVASLKADEDTPNIKSFIAENKLNARGNAVTQAEFTVHDDELKVIKGLVKANDALKQPNPAKKDKDQKAAWWSAGFIYLISQQNGLKQGVKKGKLDSADLHYGLQLLTGRKAITETASQSSRTGFGKSRFSDAASLDFADAAEESATRVDKEPLLIKVKDDKNFKPKKLNKGELYTVKGYDKKDQQITLWNSAKSAEEKKYPLADCYDDIALFAHWTPIEGKDKILLPSPPPITNTSAPMREPVTIALYQDPSSPISMSTSRISTASGRRTASESVTPAPTATTTQSLHIDQRA